MRVFYAIILCSFAAYINAFPTPLVSCKVRGFRIIQRVNSLQAEMEPLLVDLGLELDNIQTIIDYKRGSKPETLNQLTSKLQNLTRELDKLKAIIKLKARKNILQLARQEVSARGVNNAEMVDIVAKLEIFDKDALYIHKTLGVVCGLMSQPKGITMEMVASEMEELDMDEDEVKMVIGMAVDNTEDRSEVMRFINSGVCYMQILGYRQVLATVAPTDPDLVMIAANVRGLIKRCNVADSTASELKSAIPTPIWTLIDAERVCLLNVAYNETLIVDKYRDSGLRMAFTWIESNTVLTRDLRHLQYWKPEIINRNAITLQNTYHNEFLTVLSGMNRIYTGLQRTPWYIEASGKNIYLKSAIRNEYAYVGEAKFCPKRRRVKAREAKGPSSLWTVVQC